MKKFLSNREGFTLVEVLLVLTIFSTILTSMFKFYFWGTKILIANNQKIEILQHARIALNRMSRELRQAKEIYIPQGNSSEIKFINLKEEEIKFYLSGNQLLRSGGNNPIANYVQSIVFTYSGSERAIKIELVLAIQEEELKIRGVVAPRNLLVCV